MGSCPLFVIGLGEHDGELLVKAWIGGEFR